MAFQELGPDCLPISFSGSINDNYWSHLTLKVAENDTQFAWVKPTKETLDCHGANLPSLSPSHHPPPVSCTHKESRTNLKCRRCGKSAFYEQTKEQIICMFSVSGYASSNNHQVVFRARCFIEYSRHTLAVVTYR